ncbi:MAG: S-layer homology domain-containing protein [Acidimicrobiaceae bacterium]|nr:S-layer homology domain-containing protein [Acidimicrobiaceae bacterium]MYG78022.1 S-layer homology domain-containing protein [Acidimicrobiaceae bacterium]MYJ83515.1 S-layer homology domain-containing protein [Acidimicrobiaceae bacterium]
MPQPVNRRRSGMSILAAGALVASLVTVGAGPAAAAETVADHATPVTACVGDATTDWMFSDVSAGSIFQADINCLAYYGVTIGYGDGTFRPGNYVSRFEMVLFMQRSARIAGADPAAVVSDFATTGSDPVNRADMALLIARLLASATSNDSRVNVVLESDGTFTVGGAEPDDAFTDSRRTQPIVKDSAASALFELGVARGTGGGNFSPEASVTRGQMAAFITRALAHTTARPEGVSVQQYLPGEVTVSVRDEVFAPVSNAAIDVFSIASPDAHRAFRSDGSCSSLVTDETGSRSCEIDVLDPVTGPDGDFTIGLGPTEEQDVTVWAWTGALGDVIRSGDDRLASVEVTTQGVEATGAKVTNSLPENATHARFGSTVTVTVQLVGVNGLRAVPPEDGASYTIRKEAFNQIDGPADPGSSRLTQRSTETVEVDDTGKIEIILEGVDPESNDTGDIAADEILWRYTVTPSGDSPQLDEPVEDVRVVFTDASPVATTIDLATQVKYLRAARSSTRPVSNVVIATVTDQYGQPFRGARVALESITHPAPLFMYSGPVATGSSGTARIGYQHSGTQGTRETLSASVAGVTDTVDFLWAVDPPAGSEVTTGGGTYEVLAADPQRNEVVVDLTAGFGTATVVAYDGNDRFRLDGTIVSLSLFESVLANELDDDTSILLLGWSSRDPDNQADRTDWFLVT